uniref:Uncharacterized protein n=1 Tax=Phage sp. ctGns7 TaxID=2828003 RepID=A0A8S5S8Y5_9VIRU|nr:MAG TPA: hypothetical protein [Phage sp. ctGns7]
MICLQSVHNFLGANFNLTITLTSVHYTLTL